MLISKKPARKLYGHLKDGTKFAYHLENELNKNTPLIDVVHSSGLITAYHSNHMYMKYVDVTNFGHKRGQRCLHAYVDAADDYALQIKDELDAMFRNDWWLAAIAGVWEKKTGTSATVIAKVKEYFTP